jgi:hypothetical protein
MTTITAEEVKARLDAGEKINLVDVREPHEHAEFNIGGTLLPLGQVHAMQVEVIDDLRGEEVICYCRSGTNGLCQREEPYRRYAALAADLPLMAGCSAIHLPPSALTGSKWLYD